MPGNTTSLGVFLVLAQFGDPCSAGKLLREWQFFFILVVKCWLAVNVIGGGGKVCVQHTVSGWPGSGAAQLLRSMIGCQACASSVVRDELQTAWLCTLQIIWCYMQMVWSPTDHTWDPEEAWNFLCVSLNLYGPVPGQMDLNSDLSCTNINYTVLSYLLTKGGNAFHGDPSGPSISSLCKWTVASVLSLVKLG